MLTTGWDDDALDRLATAARRGDPVVVDIVRGRPLGPVVQQAGDAVTGALTSIAKAAARPGVPEVVTLAVELAATARERGWPGDEHLASALERALGLPTSPAGPPTPVDVSLLSAALEDDATAGAWLDVAAGRLVAAAEAESSPVPAGGWLPVRPIAPDPLPDDLAVLAGLVMDDEEDAMLAGLVSPVTAARVDAALSEWPELAFRWRCVRTERRLGRARRWLAEQGWTAGPASRP